MCAPRNPGLTGKVSPCRTLRDAIWEKRQRERRRTRRQQGSSREHRVSGNVVEVLDASQQPEMSDSEQTTPAFGQQVLMAELCETELQKEPSGDDSQDCLADAVCKIIGVLHIRNELRF
eukprot:SAG31_NODE_2615_length_5371_cov_89.477238_3_plen_119_part_00